MEKAKLFEMTLASLLERSNMDLQQYFSFIEKCHKLDEEEAAGLDELPEDFEGEM